MFNIASRGLRYNASTVKLPAGVQLLSIDRNVVHAQISSNGMHLVVIPNGKGGSAMMRRLCVGGSRLEDASCAGAAHVIEHMDFRSLDWLKYSGMVKNASTSKLFIQHEAYMLLDPKYRHVQNELNFQKETMLGQNLKSLSNEAIAREINNVRDEGSFNSQVGSGLRAVVMEMEKTLLPRVWANNANVLPTIGTNSGLSNLKTSDDMLRMHHMFRSADRTYMVVSGPVDVNATLALLHHTFKDVPPTANDILRPIPQTVAPQPMPPPLQTISIDSGRRYVAIGGVHGAYGKDTDVGFMMQHLVAMLGAQPVVKQNGVEQVTLYFTPGSEASVVSLVANVTSEGAEFESLARAQQVLEQFVIAPLQNFDDCHLLQQLLNKYTESLHTALQSGPQESAALAVQGILLCGQPSLAWHVKDRFNAQTITPERIRSVSRSMFHPHYSAVVRCTAHAQNVVPGAVCSLQNYGSPSFNMHVDCTHLHPDIPHTQLCTFLPVEHCAKYNKEKVYNRANEEIATIAYNTTQVCPLDRRSLTCSFGSVQQYGGWAPAQLIVSAMNAVAQACQSSNCVYKLERQEIHATVDGASSQGFENSLYKSLAIATALSRPNLSLEMQNLHRELPHAALNIALDETKKMYDNPSQLALTQAQHLVCSESDAGFMPQDLDGAIRLLSTEHQFIHSLIPQLCAIQPKLAGTNICGSHLHGIAHQLTQLQHSVALPMNGTLNQLDRRNRLIEVPNKLQIVHEIGNLHTYPYVATVRGRMPLKKSDRAALLVSNQIMCGGMGSVYTHDLRQRGVSYRPSGGVQLSWQSNPVLTLNATFDADVKDQGQTLTKENLHLWRTGDRRVFTPRAVETAKESIKEQLLLTCMDFESQKFSLLANLNEHKFSTVEMLREINKLNVDNVAPTLMKYFGQDTHIYESWVI